MPTEIETKALEAACEKATDKLEIDWDGDEPFVRSDSIETAVEAAIRAYLAALDSPIGEQGVGEPALTWRVGEWGDGSTKPGEAVIFCDGMETAIAAGIARHEADKIVAEHNAAVSPERKEPGWRDIASAPRDGTKILLAKIVGHPDHPTALWWATRGYWSDKWKNWNDGFEPSGLADPTHWLPMSAHGVGAATPEQPT